MNNTIYYYNILFSNGYSECIEETKYRSPCAASLTIFGKRQEIILNIFKIGIYRYIVDQVVSITDISLYSSMCLFGFLCNIMMITYIVCCTQKRSATTIYLLNLAFADTLFILNEFFSILIMFITKNRFHGIFGYISCKLDSVFADIGMIVSSFIISIMSFDRYLAVRYPIKSLTWRRPHVAKWISIFVWIICLFLTCPLMYFVKYEKLNNRVYCNVEIDPYRTFYEIYNHLIFFGIPWSLTVIFSCLVVVKLNRSSKSSAGLESRTLTNRKITRLIFIIILAYMICWLPFWISEILKFATVKVR